MFDSIKLRALRALPKNAVSRALGALSDISFPGPMQRTINETFAALVGIDVEEAEHPPSSYATLNELFTRRLRERARPIGDVGSGDMVAPVDGRLTHHGPLQRQTLIQAKGRRYTVRDLLDSAPDAAPFVDGHYATFYLSPRDYHRIHSPSRGRVVKVGYVPGQLFPVNPFAVEHIDQLFTINERLISYLACEELGRVAVVKVGATVVGRIGLSFDDFQTNQPFRYRRDIELPEPVDVEHGEELGVFNLGSTVVILVENPDFRFDSDLRLDQMVQMGTPIGSISSEA